MKILPILFLTSFCLSQGKPLNEIKVKPDFLMEVIENPSSGELHTLNYRGLKVIPISEDKLVELREKRFARQIIFGNISTKNDKPKILNINKYEILNGKVVIPSEWKSITYLMSRETFLRVLDEEIIINWDKWSDIMVPN